MFTCTGYVCPVIMYVCPVIMYVGRQPKRGWTRTLKAWHTGQARTAPRTRKQASPYSPQPTSTFVCNHTHACKHKREWITCARSHVQMFTDIYLQIYIFVHIYAYVFMHTYVYCACRSRVPILATTSKEDHGLNISGATH